MTAGEYVEEFWWEQPIDVKLKLEMAFQAGMMQAIVQAKQNLPKGPTMIRDLTNVGRQTNYTINTKKDDNNK